MKKQYTFSQKKSLIIISDDRKAQRISLLNQLTLKIQSIQVEGITTEINTIQSQLLNIQINQKYVDDQKERQSIAFKSSISKSIIIYLMNIKGKSRQYRELYQSFKRQSEQFQLQENKTHYATFGQTNVKPKKSNKILKNLELISIKDLTINNVHKGRYLKLRMILPPFKVNAIRLLAEDHTQQNCIDISLYNFQLKGNLSKQYFPVGSTFYIKQPFFKISMAGTNIIRIDDPSQIVLSNTKEAQELIGQNKQKVVQLTQTDKELQRLQELRLQGIDYMNRNQYVNAYLLYSQAFRDCNKQDYKIKFLLNKGIVCMRLNLKQQYGQYIDEALKLDKTNKKILYHKGKQLAIIGRLQEAQKMLNSQAFDSSTKDQLTKFIKIQRSFKQNKIDWYRALKYRQLGELFHEDIKIDKSPYGRGIFAKKNIKAGQVIIVERPLLSTTQEDSKQIPISDSKTFAMFGKMLGKSGEAEMKNNILQLYHLSTEFHKKIDKLSSSNQAELQKYNISPIKGSQMDLQSIAQNNWFELSQLDEFFQCKKSCVRTGLYQKISMLNHCCEYNCERFCLGDTMIVYCIKDINAGEELFITYKASQNFIQRRQSLAHWNIQCHCIFCQEQEYELIHGQPMVHGKSHQMERQRMRLNFKKNGISAKDFQKIEEFYDMHSISLTLIVGGDPVKAAKMLRRIFPMPQDKSIELIWSYKML